MPLWRRVAIVVANLVLFWALLPAAIYFSGRWLEATLGLPALGDGFVPAGVLLAAFGLAFALWAVLLLKWKGKGLPISALPPAAFVATGPYRACRHPIYTGYAVAAAGLGLAARSTGIVLATALVAAGWFATWVTLYEEPGLLRRFGNGYRVYKAGTPRFLPFSLKLAARRVVLAAFRLFFKVNVKGRQHVPRHGPFLLVTDHLSYLDFIFGQYASARPIAIPVTAEVFRHPLRAAFMRMMGGIPTRRYCPDHAAYLALADALSAGNGVGIAIEGERSWSGSMSLPSAGVARNLMKMSPTVIPMAFQGAYRLWPRWGNGADRQQSVTLVIGEPFALADEAARLRREGENLVEGETLESAAARVLRDRIAALRPPDAESVCILDVAGARPELALWLCPQCGEEERISLVRSVGLVCGACGAKWDCHGSDMTLVEPAPLAGAKRTLAGWLRRASWSLPALAEGVPLLTAACEWREDCEARTTLQVLQSRGSGQAVLYAERLEWRGGNGQLRVDLADVLSVTTERNDTLQLGVGRGVVQLIFERSSPWRWHHYVAALTGRNVPGGLMEDGTCRADVGRRR